MVVNFQPLTKLKKLVTSSPKKKAKRNLNEESFTSCNLSPILNSPTIEKQQPVDEQPHDTIQPSNSGIIHDESLNEEEANEQDDDGYQVDETLEDSEDETLNILISMVYDRKEPTHFLPCLPDIDSYSLLLQWTEGKYVTNMLIADSNRLKAVFQDMLDYMCKTCSADLADEMEDYFRVSFVDLMQKLEYLNYQEEDDPKDKSFHEDSVSVTEEDSVINEDHDVANELKVTFKCKYYISSGENVPNNLDQVKVPSHLQLLLDFIKEVFRQPTIPFAYSESVESNFPMKLFKYFRVLEDIVSKGMKEFNEIYINAPHCMNLSAFKVCVDHKANKKESEYTFSKRILFWLGCLCGDRNLMFTENLKTAATRKHQLRCRPDIEVPHLAFDIECKLFSLLQKKFEDDLVKILMLPYWLIHDISVYN